MTARAYGTVRLPYYVDFNQFEVQPMLKPVRKKYIFLS